MGAALDRATSVDPGPVAGDGFGGVGDGVGGIREVAIAIPGPESPWGVMTIASDEPSFSAGTADDMLPCVVP